MSVDNSHGVRRWNEIVAVCNDLTNLMERVDWKHHPIIRTARSRAVESDDPVVARQLRDEAARTIFGRLAPRISDQAHQMNEWVGSKTSTFQRRLAGLRQMSQVKPWLALEALLSLQEEVSATFSKEGQRPLSVDEIKRRLLGRPRSSARRAG